jgi:hypothetical protein
VVLDFEGVTIASVSFFDESFGVLAQNHRSTTSNPTASSVAIASSPTASFATASPTGPFSLQDSVAGRRGA